MLKLLKSLFAHKHHFKYVGSHTHTSQFYHLSGAPITANIFKCSCGEEYRELTPAGEQQLNDFGDSYKRVIGEE